ncbi:MAG: hypothetical protein PHQ74_12350 [Crocinitomicaceae bacterium]|nr:hypothetical protein [Crocinitomicaceae bacterium]
MTFDLLYALFWITLIFLGLRYLLIFKNNTELNKLTAYGFLLKSVGIVCLMLVFNSSSKSSNLFVDSVLYMQDTKYLNDVFHISPILYFKFLTGIGETNDLIVKYLPGTFLWDEGHGLYNDSKNVVRINSLIYFISRGNVFIHIVFMSLISTLGIRMIVVAFKKHMARPQILFAILLFLIPSLFVATGGVLKEPFVIFGIGLFLFAFSIENRRKSRFSFLVLALFFLIFIKPYILIALLIAGLFILFSKYIYTNKPYSSLLLFVLFSFFIFLTIKPIRENTLAYVSRKQLDMERIAEGGVYVFDNGQNPRILHFKIEELGNLEIKNDSMQIIKPIIAGKSTMDLWEDLQIIEIQPGPEKWRVYAHIPVKANSYFHTTPIRNSLPTFLKTIPEAFINGLLRPFPSDLKSLYTYPAMLEVYFCIGIFVFALFNRRKISFFEKRVIGGLIIFSVLLLILIGFTTPVVGALVRYRIPAFMAILVISFIILKIPEKWKNRIQ